MRVMVCFVAATAAISAAEKRRAEQIKQRDCAKKAETEKVMARERTAFLLHCLEAAQAPEAGKPADAATAAK